MNIKLLPHNAIFPINFREEGSPTVTRERFLHSQKHSGQRSSTLSGTKTCPTWPIQPYQTLFSLLTNSPPKTSKKRLLSQTTKSFRGQPTNGTNAPRQTKVTESSSPESPFPINFNEEYSPNVKQERLNHLEKHSSQSS